MTDDNLFERFWEHFLEYIPNGFEPIFVKADLNGICKLYAKDPNKTSSDTAYYIGDFLSVDKAMDCEKYLKAKYFSGR